MMTFEEIFSKVATHMLVQNAKSETLDDDGIEQMCAYRGEGGRMCAVGCLIKDEAYLSEIEGFTVSCQAKSAFLSEEDLMLRSALAKSDVPINTDTLLLLQRLQGIHDGHPVEQWGTKLNDLACTYGFEPIKL